MRVRVRRASGSGSIVGGGARPVERKRASVDGEMAKWVGYGTEEWRGIERSGEKVEEV